MADAPFFGGEAGWGSFSVLKALYQFNSDLIATIGFLVILILPEAIMKIFTRDSNLIAVGRNALRLCMIMLPLAGCQALGAAFFQALGKPVPAILLSLSRQVLALIPLIIFLPLFFGLDGIWFSLPIADLVSFFITLPLVMMEFRKMPKFNPNALPVSGTESVVPDAVYGGGGQS